MHTLSTLKKTPYRVVSCSSLLLTTSLPALTWTVDTTAPTGGGSLREAMTRASNNDLGGNGGARNSTADNSGGGDGGLSATVNGIAIAGTGSNATSFDGGSRSKNKLSLSFRYTF